MTWGGAGGGGCEGRYKPPELALAQERQRDSARLPAPRYFTAALCTAPHWIRMVASRRCWVSIFSLTCCLALLLGHLASAAPTHPKYPGDDAPVEELAQFYNELQQYLNMITRPRYGKRSSSRTLSEDPYDAPGC